MNKNLTRAERRKLTGDTSSSKVSLHPKAFVFDRSNVFIGSLNLDPRSVVENTEIGVVLTSSTFRFYGLPLYNISDNI